MFDEIFLRTTFGCKLLPGHFAVGRFSYDRIQSIVAISHTLDKLVVHDFSPDGLATSSKYTHTNGNDGNHFKTGFEGVEVGGGGGGGGGTGDNTTTSPLEDNLRSSFTINSPVYYIAVKEVIKSISVKQCKILFANQNVLNNTFEGAANEAIKTELPLKHISESNHLKEQQQIRNESSIDDTTSKDLLLIGCSSSILIHDTLNRSNSITIYTSGPINAITNEIHSEKNSDLIICGGSQKIYALKLESALTGSNFNAEISSERSIGDTVTCSIKGNLDDRELVITGSVEQKICIYQLDLFDQNIQSCSLTLEETGPVNCLCPILTLSKEQQNVVNAPGEHSRLPSISDQNLVVSEKDEQMNYFSYGTESAIGVYRLLKGTKIISNSEKTLFSAERLWRQKCKYPPLAMLMYDINGDGLDELVIGFKNGRIEARSPFTGQLLAATRCFTKSDRLTGLAVIDYYQDGKSVILLACSTNGSVIGFKPQVSGPRISLRGYSLPKKQNLDDSQQGDWPDFPFSLHENAATANLKTIEEKEDRNMNAYLHIESQSDETKITRCETKQSFQLLHKLNVLQIEQMELERKACRIYHMNMHRSSKFLPSDVNINHRWGFDPTTAFLRLTIVISTCMEDIELIQLEDETKNMIKSGFMLVNPQSSSKEDPFDSQTKKSHIVVIPLQSRRDVETKLCLKVFCIVKQPINEAADNTNKLARVYNKSIDVPKFAMFAFASPGLDTQYSKLSLTSIKLDFLLKDEAKVMQVLDWLKESFLCFQFDNLIRNNSQSQTGNLKAMYPWANSITNHPHVMVDESRNFEVNLVDLRYALKKIATNTNLDSQATSAFEQHLQSNITSQKEQDLKDGGCKFPGLGSTLRIVHSNETLTLDCESSDLVVDLVQSLMIDRLHFELTSNKLQKGDFVADVGPILVELDMVTKNLSHLEESEKRIQTELYESADYARNLMQQLAIANELNEFTIAKELLNELFIMLTEAQNAARTHCLNNKRAELFKEANLLRNKISFLTGQLNDKK